MNLLISLIFLAGYLLIATENAIKINKAAIALITGVACWTAYVLISPDKHLPVEQLNAHLGDLSGILFFLLSAMTVVELIDSHDGFRIITGKIRQTNKRKLVWIIGFLTFFMSAVLDNLTTTIVMISLLRKLVNDQRDRLYFSGIVVIAANSGGAFSPIGDVTTTMLWIGEQISALRIMTRLILPALVSLVVPLLFVSFRLKGTVDKPELAVRSSGLLTNRQQKIILFSGIAVLLLVPVFKTLTGLPPYMGILMGLGLIWILTEVIHQSKDDEEKEAYSVVRALRKIDTSTILFFLGILLAVSALQSSGLLTILADFLVKSIGNLSITVIIIGLLSSVVDNVPLVAAAQGMFDLSLYPTDHYFWEFLAYSAGTGGSILIIGSAAGVAAMGMENISFIWYLKKIAWLALLGFLAGAGVYILQDYLVMV